MNYLSEARNVRRLLSPASSGRGLAIPGLSNNSGNSGGSSRGNNLLANIPIIGDLV
jgi:hypothetical protein